MENNKSKMELYEEKQKQNKKTLDKQEIADIEFSRKRHQENEEQWETFMILLKMPYYIFFKIPAWIIGKVTYTEKRRALEKENKRLKLVMKSKERAREKAQFNTVIDWDNKYMLEDGIFNIGIDENGQIQKLDFNKFANLLIGGLPGGGKSKLIQLLGFQCLKHNCKITICDFKGGLDSQKWENKCTVITQHEELLNVLMYFKKQINIRIEMFKEVGAENLKEYNEITGKNLKREYLFIDELGEALEIDVEGMTEKEEKQLKKDIEKLLRKLARLGRALGLNIIAGTQRPDVTILEGQTRSQFGCRVCFQADKNTSLIVIDSKLADELPEIAGRAIVKKRKDYINLQVFKFNPDMLREIENKKLSKNDLKVVKGNTEIDKDIETIDIELD